MHEKTTLESFTESSQSQSLLELHFIDIWIRYEAILCMDSPPRLSHYFYNSDNSSRIVPYKFYVLGQVGLSKQCRPRSDCFKEAVWSGSTLFTIPSASFGYIYAMLHQTFQFLGQLWQLFKVSQILEFLRYSAFLVGKHRLDWGYSWRKEFALYREQILSLRNSPLEYGGKIFWVRRIYPGFRLYTLKSIQNLSEASHCIAVQL